MKNKIIIIYKSSTGFTKKYAEMIAEEIGCTLADYKTAAVETLSHYDTVVFGTRAHAGMIDGYKKIKKMFQKSAAGHFVLFVTGASPDTSEDTLNAFWSQNLSAEELEKIPHFYMPAGLCYEKMSFPDKLMMKTAAAFMKRSVKKKQEKTEMDLAVERMISSSYDISDKTYIDPLVSYLKTTAANHT